jgi:hypothetical protein
VDLVGFRLCGPHSSVEVQEECTLMSNTPVSLSASSLADALFWDVGAALESAVECIVEDMLVDASPPLLPWVKAIR